MTLKATLARKNAVVEQWNGEGRMIEFDDAAREKISELLQSEDRRGKLLRIQILGRGPDDFRYSLRFIPPAERTADDLSIESGGFEVVVDPESAANLKGARVEFVENAYQSGFHRENPNPMFQDPLEQSVHEVLKHKINPGVAAHGGFVTLLEVRDHVAYVELGGGCQGCGLADITLKQGIDVMIREAVPEIQQVVDTTDHASGSNPYYQPAKGAPAPGSSPLARN